MKAYLKVLVVASAAWFTSKVAAQGTIWFSNRFLDGAYHAPVTLPDGTPLIGDTFTAGLFLVRGGSLDLLATAPFIRDGFFANTLVTVDGISWGQPVTVRVRVWESSAGSYSGAILTGKLYGEFPTDLPNNEVFLPMLGGDPPFGVLPPARLKGIQPFTLVPEPTTCAILALGCFLCFSHYRRK